MSPKEKQTRVHGPSRLAAKMADPARPGGPCLTVQAASELVGLHRSSIEAMMTRGELPEVRVGRRRFVPLAAVQKKFAAVLGKPAA